VEAIVPPRYRKNRAAGTALEAKAGRLVKVPRPVRRRTATFSDCRQVQISICLKGNAYDTIAPMALTRDFKETVKARADRDPAFREALLTEAVEHLITGRVDVGKAVLRDYINATMGFARLAKATGTPSKSLMRMLGPKGNPRANNLLAMIGKLQRVSGVRLAVGTGARKRAA
jgi:DNA-binding phage protein